MVVEKNVGITGRFCTTTKSRVFLWNKSTSIPEPPVQGGHDHKRQLSEKIEREPNHDQCQNNGQLAHIKYDFPAHFG